MQFHLGKQWWGSKIGAALAHSVGPICATVSSLQHLTFFVGGLTAVVFSPRYFQATRATTYPVQKCLVFNLPRSVALQPMVNNTRISDHGPVLAPVRDVPPALRAGTDMRSPRMAAGSVYLGRPQKAAVPSPPVTPLRDVRIARLVLC